MTLVLLLITPAEQPDLQVLHLGQIARLAGNPDVRSRLTTAAKPFDVSNILAVSA